MSYLYILSTSTWLMWWGPAKSSSCRAKISRFWVGIAGPKAPTTLCGWINTAIHMIWMGRLNIQKSRLLNDVNRRVQDFEPFFLTRRADCFVFIVHVLDDSFVHHRSDMSGIGMFAKRQGLFQVQPGSKKGCQNSELQIEWVMTSPSSYGLLTTYWNC